MEEVGRCRHLNIMKIKSSLKSIKNRDLNSKLVRRGEFMLSIKLILNLKQDKVIFMDNENHKNTWNNFTKFVLWGTVAVISVLVLMALFLL